MSEKFMRVVMKAMLVLACASAGCAVQNNKGDMPLEQQQVIENAILKVHEDMKMAAQRLDVDALYSFVLDSNGPIIEDGRLKQTRQEAMDSTKQGLKGITDLSYTYNQKFITVISPTVALWVGEGTSSATIEDGRKISVPFAETIIFVQRDGQWKVLHAHRSLPNPR
jgi:ketosteroid isomerase-like protein